MARSTRLAAALTGALAVAGVFAWACGTNYTNDAGNAGADASGANEASSDAGVSVASPATFRDGACAQANNACLAVPDSWHGPVTTLVAPASCAGDFSFPLGQKHENIVDGSALPCGCDCTQPSACSYTLIDNSATGCGTSVGTMVPTPGVCTPITGGMAVKSVNIQHTNLECVAAVAGNLSDASTPYSDDLVWCAPEVASAQEGCNAGELCSPTSAPLCVVSEGDLPCPAGFSNRAVGYATVTDSRECTGSCGCSTTAVGTCADASIGFGTINGTTCDVAQDSPALNKFGTCAELNAAYTYLIVMGTSENNACAIEGGAAPSGSLTATEPTTICCIP